MKTLAILILLTFPALGQKPVPCVNKYVTYSKLTQHQFDALVDFTYNLGCGSLRGSTLLKKLNAGDIEGAANEFPRWNKIGKIPNAGLTRRRIAEQKLFRSEPWR